MTNTIPPTEARDTIIDLTAAALLNEYRSVLTAERRDAHTRLMRAKTTGDTDGIAYWTQDIETTDATIGSITDTISRLRDRTR